MPNSNRENRMLTNPAHRVAKEVSHIKIIIPDLPDKHRTPYQKQKLRKGFKRIADIEPKISHLKQEHQLIRNFYKAIKG